MDTTLIAAIISALVTTIGIMLAYIRWRIDVKVQLENLRDEITVELIRKRMDEYGKFLQKMEPMSHIHEETIRTHREIALEFVKVLQEGMYSNVGLLCSHHTRYIMGLTREYCRKYGSNEKDSSYDELKKRVWALQLALKSDLGIPQPEMHWLSEFERLRKRMPSRSNEEIKRQVEALETHTFGRNE
jgi:hypothetical protein